MATGPDWVKATPRAAAMSGAVQGAATTAARTPVKKLPVAPDRPASDWPIPVQDPAISNTPARFSPTANRI